MFIFKGGWSISLLRMRENSGVDFQLSQLFKEEKR